MVTKTQKGLVFKALRIDPNIWGNTRMCAEMKHMTVQAYVSSVLESANKKVAGL